MLARLTIVLLLSTIGLSSKAQADLEQEAVIARGESYVVEYSVVNDGPLLVTVDQVGIDITLALHVGTVRASETDSHTGGYGREYNVTDAVAGETVTVVVSPPSSPGPDGRILLKITELGAGADERYLAAVRAAARSGQSYLDGSQAAFEQARDEMETAAAIWAETGDTEDRAYALTAAGSLRRVLSDLVGAESNYDDAVRALADTPNDIALARILHMRGNVRWLQGKFDEAQRDLLGADALYRRLGLELASIFAAMDLCTLAEKRGELIASVECNGRAASRLEAFGDQRRIGTLKNNIGLGYEKLDRFAEALDSYNAAIDAFRSVQPQRVGVKLSAATAVSNKARLYTRLGRYQESAAALVSAFAIFVDTGDRIRQGIVLGQIAEIYAEMGERDLAYEYASWALETQETVGRPDLVVNSHERLAELAWQAGDFDRARYHHEELLGVLESGVSSVIDASARVTYARHLTGMSEYVDARRQLDRSLRLSAEQQLTSVRAAGLEALSRLEVRQGRPAEAQAYAREALALREAIGDSVGAIEANQLIASIALSLDDAEAAVIHASAAKEAVEALRSAVHSPGFTARFYDGKDGISETLLVALLQLAEGGDADYLWRAFEVSDSNRARTLRDSLANPRNSVDDATLTRRREIARELSRLIGPLGPEPSETARREVLALLLQLELLEAAAATANPSVEVPGLSATEAPDRELLSDALGEDTCLVEFYTGHRVGLVFRLCRGELAVFPGPNLSSAQALIDAVFPYLASPNGYGYGDAYRAAESMLGDVLAEVEADRLVIVADGPLHLLPFAALPVPGHPERSWRNGRLLIDDFEVVKVPSASVIPLLRSRDRNREQRARALVIADPVFSGHDSRVDNALAAGSDVRGLPRLPGTAVEAGHIAQLLPAADVTLLTGFQASKEAVFASDIDSYRLIHFATHAEFNTTRIGRSGLYLSSLDPESREIDGFLSLFEIGTLDLDLDLLVLSACQTAFGEHARGEGVLGITRGFMLAGADRVVASLWRVPSMTTTSLMQSFYSRMLVDGTPAAASLRAAQSEIRRKHAYSHPFFWAAFEIHGDWE